MTEIKKKRYKTPSPNDGRPRIDINWDAFDSLCRLQCTLLEIASFFNCTDETIERRVKQQYNETFMEHYKKASAGGKSSLRREQWKSALRGNVSMQIWLGKQWLGQKDTIALGNSDDKPLMLTYRLDDDNNKQPKPDGLAALDDNNT